jgi:hypothetical protein
MSQSLVEVLKGSTTRGYDTGVSLHAHTWHSRETLAFLPDWMESVPVLSGLFQRELERYQRKHGRSLDFARASWRPPLMPLDVWESERAQIADRLGLAPLVSITDHDSLEAPAGLQACRLRVRVPFSVEWTVPYRGSIFHVGVHNILPDVVSSFAPALAAYTARPADDRLAELLSFLHEFTGTLIVLNHPLWDGHTNNGQNRFVLADLLDHYGTWIHALEVNGYRRWSENQRLLEVHERWRLPLISGGDRHGLTPNAVLNLSRADSFEGFVDEIRVQRRSHIVVMPDYLDHATREVGALSEILGSDSSLAPGHRHWSQRLFIASGDGRERPLVQEWDGALPWWLRGLIGTLRLAGSHTVRPVLRAALAGGQLRLF